MITYTVYVYQRCYVLFLSNATRLVRPVVCELQNGDGQVPKEFKNIKNKSAQSHLMSAVHRFLLRRCRIVIALTLYKTACFVLIKKKKPLAGAALRSTTSG